jgi:hypothetical protein
MLVSQSDLFPPNLQKTICHAYLLSSILTIYSIRFIPLNLILIISDGRSQWPRGLRREPAAARLWGCGFEFRWGYGCLSLVSVVCRQVEVSATGRSLVQRSPTECGVSECDREASIVRRPWPIRGCCAMGKNISDKE